MQHARARCGGAHRACCSLHAAGLPAIGRVRRVSGLASVSRGLPAASPPARLAARAGRPQRGLPGVASWAAGSCTVAAASVSPRSCVRRAGRTNTGESAC
eukprot:332401-Chlamydomonas_euryale.AAC.5